MNVALDDPAGVIAAVIVEGPLPSKPTSLHLRVSVPPPAPVCASRETRICGGVNTGFEFPVAVFTVKTPRVPDQFTLPNAALLLLVVQVPTQVAAPVASIVTELPSPSESTSSGGVAEKDIGENNAPRIPIDTNTASLVTIDLILMRTPCQTRCGGIPEVETLRQQLQFQKGIRGEKAARTARAKQRGRFESSNWKVLIKLHRSVIPPKNRDRSIGAGICGGFGSGVKAASCDLKSNFCLFFPLLRSSSLPQPGWL